MCRGSKRWVERLSVVGWNGEMGWREAGCFDGGKMALKLEGRTVSGYEERARCGGVEEK